MDLEYSEDPYGDEDSNQEEDPPHFPQVEINTKFSEADEFWEEPSPPRRKGRRRYEKSQVFTNKQEKDLVEWLKQNPIFYDKKLHIYKDSDLRSRLLAEKAREYRVPRAHLRTWMLTMRTRYGRLSAIHDPETVNLDDLTERDRWIYESFEFLRPHIIRCPTRGKQQERRARKRKSQPSTSYADGDSEDEDEEEPPTTPKKKSKSSNTNNEFIINDVLNKLQDQYQLTTNLQTHVASLLQPLDEHEAAVVQYTNYLATLCRQMSPQAFRTFQKHTSNLAMDLVDNPDHYRMAPYTAAAAANMVNTNMHQNNFCR